MPLARDAAVKALELDPDLAEAHLSLALVKSRYEWDAAGAEAEFRKALFTGSGMASTHEQYGMFLASVGRFPDALKELEQALRLDPVSGTTRVSMGLVHYYSKQYDRAIEQYQKAIEMEPKLYLGHMYLGIAYRQKGMFAEGEAALRRALELDEVPMASGMLGHTYAAWGRKGEAEALLKELSAPSGRHWVSPFYAAIVYVGLGDRREALAWLRRAYDERAEDIAFIEVDPVLDPLRAEPEFAELLRIVRDPTLRQGEAPTTAPPSHTR